MGEIMDEPTDREYLTCVTTWLYARVKTLDEMGHLDEIPAVQNCLDTAKDQLREAQFREIRGES
tara:strand:- start:563 stop:754 length:192 start_codon:yes stop_codon:yes gene_type:complete